VVYATFFFGFGIWFFFWGFKRLRRKRKIENIPTSTVRGLAMGLVELIGKAKKMDIIISPLTATECVYFRYTVERYQSSGRSSRWVTIAKGDSSACPFWLDDGTGKVLVLSQNAEFVLPVDYVFNTSLGKPLPDNLIYFMESNGVTYRNFLGNYRLRFKEWRICLDDTVYVLGTAKTVKDTDYSSDYTAKLIKRLEELKSNPVEMSKIDLNKDGQIDMEEWDSAVAKVEQQLLEERLKSSSNKEQVDVVISQGETEKVFMISDYSQKDLTQQLMWQAFFGVFGGAILSLAMLWYLLSRFNFFSCRS
jgi:hypothetical protein